MCPALSGGLIKTISFTPAIFAGSTAGWYWFVASSPTAGTLYNNTYVSGAPTVPTVLVPFVSTGPGLITQTFAEITGPSVTLPANIMGPNGRAWTRASYTENNSANNHLHTLRFNGNVVSQAYLSSTTMAVMSCTISNRGVTNSQIAVKTSAASEFGNGGTPIALSVDTSQNTTMSATLALFNTTDYMTIEEFMVEVRYGA